MIKQQKKINGAKAVIILVLLAALILPQLIGTTTVEKNVKEEDAVTEPGELNGRTFVCLTGTQQDACVRETFPDSEIKYVADLSEMALSVQEGEADCFLIDENIIDELLSDYPDLVAMPQRVTESFHVALRSESYAYAVATDLKAEDLNREDVVISVLGGSELYDCALKAFPKARIDAYDSHPDALAALAMGKSDAALGFADNFKDIAENYPTIGIVSKPVATIRYGFGVQKNESGEKLMEKLNAYIANDWQFSGSIFDTWVDGVSGQKEYHYTGENGTLSVATNGLWYPMTFFEGEKLTGVFIEVINDFCEKNGYTPVYSIMNYNEEVAGLCAGEYDMVADSMCITPERLEQVNITDSFMASDMYIYTDTAGQSAEQVPKAQVFWQNLVDGFTKNFIRENRWKMLLSGLGVTVALALLAGIFGTLAGCGICGLRMSNNAFMTAFARLYIKLIQGTPVLVLLMVLYYIVFSKSGLPAFWVCVVGFSVDFAAYAAEIFRNGIESVPSGQARAAKALGFNKFNTFRKVVLPQALLRILPVYSGQFISMVKMTSVAGYISVMDLTKVSDIIRARTYEAFFPLISTAIIYFIISSQLVSFLKFLERKADPKLRSRQVKGVRVKC